LIQQKTYALLNELFGMVRIAVIDDDNIKSALNMRWDDFEDCVQYVAAKDFKADYIITRDENGYEDGEIMTISPHDFVELISPRALETGQ
jgi:hypothetical protein